jgi:acyl-CoA dehydrogenase
MLWIILWFLTVFVLSFVKAASSIWLISCFIVYLLMIKFIGMSIISFLVTGILIILLPLFIPFIRRQILFFLINKFNNLFPKISKTEQEAINAGDCGWEKAILTGNPNWNELHKIPKLALTDDEIAFIEGPVKELMSMIDDWQIMFRYADIPEEIWDFMKKKGFFGLIIPKKYGGLEFSPLGISKIFSILYTKSIVVATTVSVTNSLGPSELLQHYGTLEQQEYFLPRLATGKDIPCFALTSEFAGSDATSMLDFGNICYGQHKGQKTLGIKLNCSKRYITLAPVATLIGLAFKLYDPNHLIGDKKYIGITCVLIPASTPGIEIGRRHYPMFAPFQNGPIQVRDVFVPIDSVIGGKDMLGKGWGMLMESLASGRAISLPAGAVGQSQQALMATSAYALIREQFNMPISNFEGIQEVLARITANTYMIDALNDFTISIVQSGVQASVGSAISKYHTTEIARRIIKDSMDIHGGKAICIGPKNYLFATYLSTPISVTVEGANILTRSLIIFGQGLVRCHPYILDELSAVENKEIRRLDTLLCKHLSHGMYNFCRSIAYALTAGYFIKSPSKRFKKYYKRLSRYSIYLAFISDLVLLIYQGSFKRKESLSGRLSDVLSYIYIGTAVLKKYYDENELSEEIPLIEWIMEYLCYEVEQKFCDIISNLGNPFLRYGLYYLLFPYGKYTKIPTDSLDSLVASLVLKPTETRKKLIKLSCTEEANNEQYYNLNKLFNGIHTESKVYKKIKNAKKSNTITKSDPFEVVEQAFDKHVINEDEKCRLIELEKLRQMIIKVDDFDFNELRRD